jgi:hypothetical protein
VGDNRIDIVLDGGARSSLWWATKNEWLGLLDVAGLELETLYGGFAGEPFNDDSSCAVYLTAPLRRALARRPLARDLAPGEGRTRLVTASLAADTLATGGADRSNLWPALASLIRGR